MKARGEEERANSFWREALRKLHPDAPEFREVEGLLEGGYLRPLNSVEQTFSPWARFRYKSFEQALPIEHSFVSKMYSNIWSNSAMVFNQQGQQVTYQWNIAGNAYFGQVENKAQVITDLERLKTEVEKATEQSVLPEEVGTDVAYQTTKALQLAKKPDGDTKTLLTHLETATKLLTGATGVAQAFPGMVAAFQKATEVVTKLF